MQLRPRTCSIAIVAVLATSCADSTHEARPPVDPAKLIASPCVLSAGGANGSMQDGRLADGSCWLTAECVRRPGHGAPGDGFVGLTCTGTACRCDWENAADTDKGERRQTLRGDEFEIATPCADPATAKRLFTDHCMKGLKYEVAAPAGRVRPGV
jgi:hypothetical protein